MPQTNKKFLLTKEGLANIESEYIKLLEIQKPAVIKRIQTAREFGDLSENSEYDAAKEEQTLLETRILELRDILKNVQVLAETSNKDFVVIGSRVKVEIDGEVETFTIVGSLEADPANKKISSDSPVGAAMMNAKIGETVEVTTPIIRAKYKILEIK